MLMRLISPERRSSKVPVVSRERRATSRPRAAAASQQAATSFRCFPRERDQWIQDERPRADRTWQQCRKSWPGERNQPQGFFLDFMTRGARKQDCTVRKRRCSFVALKAPRTPYSAVNGSPDRQATRKWRPP